MSGCQLHILVSVRVLDGGERVKALNRTRSYCLVGRLIGQGPCELASGMAVVRSGKKGSEGVGMARETVVAMTSVGCNAS